MILKAEEIAARLAEGKKAETKDPLVIAPLPNLEKLQEEGSAAIDLRLGTWFLTLREARMSHIPVVEAEPQAAQLTKTHYVPFGGEYYLHPRSFVLGVTLEWMRLPKNMAAFVTGRSTWGRRGLIIATAVGVHPGFKGCLTLELSNVGEIPIAIKPGTRVCQIFLQEVRERGTEWIDRSQFVGLRKPRLGRVKLDDVARALGSAYTSEPNATQDESPNGAEDAIAAPGTDLPPRRS